MKSALAFITVASLTLLSSAPALGLNPSLDVTQYAHTAWTVRDGFSAGTAFAMAQTPDGYLWLGTEFGLFRFDGVRSVPWQPPSGQHLPATPYSLLVTRDGTLWIGTYSGLVSWNGTKLTRFPELPHFVTSMLEDRDGTVWAGTLERSLGIPGRLCAIRNGSIRCYGQDGAFGSFIWSLYEDGSGNLWVGAESGLWRWKPGPPRRYATPGMQLGDLTQSAAGRLIVGVRGAGLNQIAGDKLESYPIRSAISPNAPLRGHDVDSNKLLLDRDGGLWIGTYQHGLIHVSQGRTDVFRKSDGLSGDIIAGIFEDREGNIWVSTSGGLDRFRDLTVTTVSTKQGLSSDYTNSVIAAADGSMWVATRDGLTRWKNGQRTIFRKSSGLPNDSVQSLFQDDRGRIWAFTGHGLAYFKNGRFVSVNGVPDDEVYSITGDKAGNLWLSGNRGLSHLLEGRLIEHFPESVLGHRETKVILSDQGGVWLSFWTGGGVQYFKDGQLRASYTAANGLPKGAVANLRVDADGAMWAATENGGLSRIKGGRIATLTAKNGLPCDAVHWSIEDDDHSLWLYGTCGLVRIARTELDAWIADPKRGIQSTVWDAADGAMHRAGLPYFGPPVAKSTDGKLWYATGEGVLVVDPRHRPVNQLPPPVHIEQISADRKIYWQNLLGAAVSEVRLPARTRDLAVNYTALSLVAPEKIHFKYKLEGQDSDWREVVNNRLAQYTNLPPKHYKFRVLACNNSGVWNEEGASLDFVIPPAWYQTNWFRAVCTMFFVGLLWAAYQWRLRQLARQFSLALDARVAERTRIGRELHDTLLQSFQGVLLKFQSVLKRLPERPIEAKDRMERALDQATEAITEARDAVQGLRSSALHTNDLADCLARVGEELMGDGIDSKSAVIHVQVEGAPRELKPIVLDEAYRIACEALRNAVRHAQARQIAVEIQYSESRFRLRVRDDGRGMAQETVERQPPTGHFGLHGMRERAEIIGAQIDVWSKLDSGTAIDLSVPANVAYSVSSGKSLFHLFSKRRPDHGARNV